jgi:dTDP-4-dehydrorhamnose 3,5-epimerase
MGRAPLARKVKEPKMEVIQTDIPDVFLLQPRVFSDSRGFFLETYNKHTLAGLGIETEFVQDNQSHSLKNVLRGLHYQSQHAQGKLVRVLAGEIFDVAVDLRPNSPTRGKWVGIRLSSSSSRMIWIPKGFAHGFYTCSETADVLYKVTDFYAPKYERTLLWNDPEVGIEWPLAGEPILSDKDMAGHSFQEKSL